jgi:phage terminase large subunit
LNQQLTIPETYKPFPRQQEFHRESAKYRLFGGAAGPGKSRALLEECCIQAHEVSGSDSLLLRNSYKELEKSIISQFRRHILPQWSKIGGQYLEGDKVMKWPNGSKTYFGYSENEKDIYQYQGGEFLFMGIDELTMFKLIQWLFLMSRNRCPVKGSFPNMAGATNPGNIGHEWVKSLWIDHKKPSEWEDDTPYDPNDYKFIKALIWDNPIYAKDQNYLSSLKSLPLHMRQMFLEGEWNLHIGTFFDNFTPDRNTDHAIEIKPWYSKWISIDWGFAHNCAVYWHTTLPDKRIYTYREFVANKLTPRELAMEIAVRSVVDEQDEKIDSIYLSPDAYARRDSPLTVAIQLNDELEARGMPRASHADNDRIGGWTLMYQLLDKQFWVIDRDCVKLIYNLPMLTRDPNNPEDVLKVDGDDPSDSARYGLKSKLQPSQMPLEERVMARVSHLKDQTMRQHFIPRIIRQEQSATDDQPWSMRRPNRRMM